jgi:putative peptidoglycan lipid II flippase
VSDPPVLTNNAFDEGDGPDGILRGAARAAAVLTVAGLVGQVFTMVRELFVAAKVGISSDLDALLVAAVVPMMFAGLLASGASAAIVPGYLATTREHGHATAERLLGATLSWITLIGIGTTMVVIAGAGVAVAVAGPGLDEQARAVAIGYVPLLAPTLVLSATGGFLAATFQIHDRMRSIALAWMAGPIASVVVTVVLWNDLGLTALALAMTIQQAIVVLVLIGLALRFSIMPPITLRADRAESTRFIRHAIPLTISASVLQLNLLTDRAVASLIAPGAVSALRYAEGVIRIPMNAIGPAWSAAIYPALVRASVLPESRSLGQAAAGAMRYVTVIFVPIAVATAALAPLIVQVAYVRGAFDERAASLTAAALVGFAPLLFLTMANSVLTGAHNARQRGLFLMSMGFLNAILNAVFNVGLGLMIGVAGIALSTSLTVGIVQFIKAWRLGSLDEGFPLAELLTTSARSLLASLIVAAPLTLIAWNLPRGMGLTTALALLVALATAGMVGYIALARLIGLREPWLVARTLLRSPALLRPGGR